jgi:hypothetical protein
MILPVNSFLFMYPKSIFCLFQTPTVNRNADLPELAISFPPHYLR